MMGRMNKILNVITLAGLICIVTSSPENSFNSKESQSTQNVSEFENTSCYRLPEDVIPREYFIRLKPFIVPDNFTFHGEVEITADVKNSTSKIVLHYDRIKIHNATVISLSEDGKELNLEVEKVLTEKKYDFYVIVLKSPMNAGMKISIRLSYDGILSSDLTGIFRSWYKSGNETRWIVGTQLQPTYARRVFPCFDEPAFKAVFHVSLICPDNYSAISNMPIKSISKEGLITFEATPPMSTYLMALIVSDFKNLTEIAKNRIISVSSNSRLIDQLPYSLSVIPEALNFFESRLNISYPLPKLDMAAVPDFPSVAMENWGLLIYSEMLMLHSPKVTPLSLKIYIRGLITHEITHQWFGNIVSPKLWNYLWLNEGFAEYFEYHAHEDALSSWNLESLFVVNELYEAFAVDALNTTHPVTHEVYSPSEIKSIFDSISYNKAACLIRMLEKLVGQKMFYGALSRYLKNNLYSTGTPESLWSSFEEELRLNNYNLNATVAEIMDNWTLQPGFPVITVDFDGDIVSLSQKRFFIQPSENTTNSTTWVVPLSWTKGSDPNFNDTRNVVWFKGHNMTLKIPNARNDWIIFNIQQTGFYRINYSEEMWKRIINVLKSNKRETIHELNRAAIINDLFNLARSNEVDYELLLNATTYLSEETNLIPWKAAFTGFKYLKRRCNGRPELYGLLGKYIVSLLEPHYHRLGFDEKESESHFDLLLRELTLKWLCSLGYKECIDKSINTFEKLIENNSFTISPNQQSFICCTAIKHGSTQQWNQLWKKFEDSEFAVEKYFILSGLACSQNNTHLQRLLQATITSEIGVRRENVKDVMNFVAESSHIGIRTLLTFLNDNHKEIVKYMGDENVTQEVISTLSELISTEELIKQITELVKETNDQNESLRTLLQTSIDNYKRFEKHASKLSKWLELKFNSE